MANPVELVYVPHNKPEVHQRFVYHAGMTVADLLECADVYAIHPEVREYALGIFSKRVLPEALLKPGDRVELYAPLLVCPKEKRRQRAQRTKQVVRD